VREALRSAAANVEQLSVVICQAPCVVEYKVRHEPRAVNAGACAGCGACMRIGCPAVSKTDDGRAAIDPALCNGCGQCAQYCRFKAIEEA
jgi:indolepyruvate ferredoxin oxidoreductase alpha subunit